MKDMVKFNFKSSIYYSKGEILKDARKDFSKEGFWVFL